MLKRLSVLLMSIALCIALYPVSNVFASDKNDTSLQDTLLQIGLKSNNFSVNENLTITIENKTVKLCTTFTDVNSAISEIKSDDGYLYLKNLYNLDEIDYDNYYTYKSLVYDEIEKGNESLFKLRSFLNILENSHINESILSLIEESELCINESEKEEKIMMAKLLLPYTSYVEFVDENAIELLSTSTVDVAAMTNYATRFYSIVNPQYGYWSSADCTNFASQILYAGGKEIEPLWKPYTTVWVNANSFANHFKTRLQTTSVTTFAANLNAGDFAFLDFENDGVYDHTGYVTAIGSTVTVNGYTFRNFKIAQHTSNYHEWASSSNCNWELNTGKFAIMKAYY